MILAPALLLVAASPVLALDRVPDPGSGGSAVVRAADLDSRGYGHAYRSRGHWDWRYRAAYTRWMHNEYLRAGYPVGHPHFRTYARDYPVCCRHRHW
jgi:hypothetical protein